MLTGSTFFCAFASGLFYVLATLSMKYWGGLSLLVVLPLAGMALLLAALFEIEALKSGQMARTFIIILAFEFMFTFLCAVLLLNERYSLRDTFGFLLVCTGIILLAAKKDLTVEPVVPNGAVLGQATQTDRTAIGPKVPL